MRNHQPYVTITHYKEQEFYFLNHAIQTHDGFITKEMEQFHESEKDKFIERIRLLQSKYPQSQIVSLSLALTQTVTDKEDINKASAKIFDNNYVVQESIDIGNVPTTLYFSPFAVLYEMYKEKMDTKLTLLIGLFDRKLYIMFATKDKIHESWTIGTRGLTEKQVADRVYKSMKAYYKISYKFADNIEMLLTDDSPKLLKVLREELSLNILPAQNTIHNLLHHMGGSQKRAKSSYIKSSFTSTLHDNETNGESSMGNSSAENLSDIRLNSPKIDTQKDIKGNTINTKATLLNNVASLLPLLFVLGVGAYYTLQNTQVVKNVKLKESQYAAQTSNTLLAKTSNNVFTSMGKSAELKNATISNTNIELKGVVWGIEPLRNSLTELYNGGEFVIKPLENFMTEFSFKSKI